MPNDYTVQCPRQIPQRNPVKGLQAGVMSNCIKTKRGCRTVAKSHVSPSGWYWGLLTATQAKQVLIKAPEGTFLLRDSSYQGYLLTLSVKTILGPTHLRIEHDTDMSGFDSVIVARPPMRRFEGAVDLVQHYALTYKNLASQKERLGAQKETGGANPSAPIERTLQLKLIRLFHEVSPSFQHLCHVTINQHSCCHQDLPLPGRLHDFLLEYPFVLYDMFI